MKFGRILSNLLFGLGCALAFLGLLALVLPMIDNDQLRLVLSSFEMPSERVLVNAMNQAMSFAIAHCYWVMLSGAVLTLVAALLMLWLSRSERTESAGEAFARPSVKEPFASPAFQPQPERPEDEYNPFADASVQEMLKPRAPAAENPYASAAKLDWEAILPKAETPAASPYARPAQTPPQPAAVQPQETPSVQEARHETPVAPPPETFAQPIETPKPEAEQEERPAIAQPIEIAQSQSASAPERAVPKPVEPFVPEAEAGARSQSGSRVIVRSTFPTAEKEPRAAQERSEADENPGMLERREQAEPQEDAQQVSPRIRSTMGKHHS